MALAGSFATVFDSRVRRRVGAAIGGLAFQVLLRWPSIGFRGATAVLAACAMAPCFLSAFGHLSSRSRRRVRRTVLGLTVACVVLALPAIVALVTVRASEARGLQSTRVALDALTATSSEAATGTLAAATAEFSAAARRSGAWWTAGASLVPVVAQQRRAVAVASRSAADVDATVARQAASLHDQRSTDKPGSVDLAAIRQLSAPLAVVAATLHRTLHSLDTTRSAWLASPIQVKLDAFRSEVITAMRRSDLAERVVALAPQILGGAGPRRYLVIFTNPAEARGLGGFIGAYAEVTADNGQIKLIETGRAASLDAAGSTQKRLSGPAEYLARYGAFRPASNFQDLTYSPDFPTDASVISQLYPQSGGAPLDGVLSLDPQALADLLEISGPVVVQGLSAPVSASDAASLIERKEYFEYGNGVVQDQTRHDVLQAVAAAVFTKLTTQNIPTPQSIATLLGPAVGQGHLFFWSNHTDEQGLLRELHLAGTFPRPDGGDLLSVITQNAANNKDDAYLARGIDDEVTFDPRTGSTKAALTVTLHNGVPKGAPVAFSSSYAGSGLPPDTNRVWLTVYSPLGVDMVDIGGRREGVTATPELGVTAYSAYVDVPDGATVIASFELSGQLQPSSTYHLALEQEPTVEPTAFVVNVAASRGWHVVGSGSIPVSAAHVSEVHVPLEQGG